MIVLKHALMGKYYLSHFKRDKKSGLFVGLNSSSHKYHITFNGYFKGNTKMRTYYAVGDFIKYILVKISSFEVVNNINVNGMEGNNINEIMYKLESNMYIAENEDLSKLMKLDGKVEVCLHKHVEENLKILRTSGANFKHRICFKGKWKNLDCVELPTAKMSRTPAHIEELPIINDEMYNLYGHDTLHDLWHKEIRENYSDIVEIYYNGRAITEKEILLLITILKEK